MCAWESLAKLNRGNFDVTPALCLGNVAVTHHKLQGQRDGQERRGQARLERMPQINLRRLLSLS